jgi:hypothetical protein
MIGRLLFIFSFIAAFMIGLICDDSVYERFARSFDGLRMPWATWMPWVTWMPWLKSPLPDDKVSLALILLFFLVAATVGALLSREFRAESWLAALTLFPSAYFLSAISLKYLDLQLGPFLFAAGCTPHVSDYFYYVLDNIAKGAVLDFLQSFGINLWKCSPQRGVVVGTITFALRSYTTYVVIFALVRFWRTGSALSRT